MLPNAPKTLPGLEMTPSGRARVATNVQLSLSTPLRQRNGASVGWTA